MADCIHMTREMAEQCPICRAKMDVKEVSKELARTFSEALAKTLDLFYTQAELDAAVAAERERCAKVVESIWPFRTSAEVAAAIRAQGGKT